MWSDALLRRLVCTLLAAAGVALAGCEGSGEGLDENGRPLSEGGGNGDTGNGEPKATIEAVQREVFDPRCVRCHSGANAPAGMRLDDPRTSHDSLVGVRSSEDPRYFRVEAGSADDSYLIHKLEGNQSVGDQMPPDEQPVEQDKIDLIREWIDAGAAPPAEGGNGNGNGDGGNGGSLEPTIESIQAEVFEPRCVSCHSGLLPSGPGLNLEDADTSHNNLVGVRSVQNPTLFRVEAGNAGDSYLIHKLEGTHDFGGQMPASGAPLEQDTIDVIRLWIDSGAAPPGSPSSAPGAAAKSDRPARIVSFAPPAGGIDRLLVGFDRPLDPTTAHPGTIRLVRLDAELGARDLAFRWALANPRTLLVRAPLPAGEYRLELAGDGAAPLTGSNGIAVDGDGDGRPGGDVIFEFSTGVKP